MKKLLLVITTILTMANAHAKSEIVNLAWDYPPSPYIVFTVYGMTNTTVNVSFVAAQTTNTTVSITNTYQGVLQYYVTARNTVTMRESPPSNIVTIPAVPAIPANMRLLSITVGP